MFPSSNSGRSMAVLWEVASVREVSGGGFFFRCRSIPRPLVLSILQISSPRLGEFSWVFLAHDAYETIFSFLNLRKKLVAGSKPIPFCSDWISSPFYPQQRWRHGRCHHLATGSLASISSDDTSSKAPQSFSGSAHHDQRLGELVNGEKDHGNFCIALWKYYGHLWAQHENLNAQHDDYWWFTDGFAMIW